MGPDPKPQTCDPKPLNLREALVENVMAGGDSAARGLVVGMILGAHLGFEAIPSEWLSG
ncbi:MAG: ADP-ribosylglycohydrolase family protein, partial [Syntrophobacteraceae bacterium]